MEMRSQLGRVRHLGAARDGTEHFWQQRVTSVALIPLVFWFVIQVIGLVGADYAAFKAWFGVHGNLTLFVVFIGVLFHHTWLGLEMVISDYVGTESSKVTLLLAVKFLLYLFGASCIIAALRLGLGG